MYEEQLKPFPVQDIGEHLTPGGMLATSSGETQSSCLARCGKSLEGDTDAEGYPFEGSVQQVLTPVINT
jgi:hypothetical protein